MEAAMCEPMADDDMAALLERYGDAQEEFEHRGGYDLDTRAQAVLTGLGIGPDAYRPPGGIVQRRLEDAHRPGQDPDPQPGRAAAG